MRNPILVKAKGRMATQMLGGRPLESSDHVQIVAEHKGEVYGTVDLLFDDDGGAQLELISVEPNRRNTRPVILPLLRKAFAYAKEQGAEQLTSEACHQKIYNLAIRFRMPDWIAPNSALINNLFDTQKKVVDPTEDYYWKKGGKISVPLENLPPPEKLYEYPCRNDAHECDGSSYYNGPKIRKGDFFTDGFKIYQWTKTKKEDGKTASVVVMNVQYRYDYNGPNGAHRPYYIAWKELQPSELGKVLPEKSPLDDPKVNTSRLPMLKMGWFL